MRSALLSAYLWLASMAVASAASAKGPADAYYGRGTSNVFWFMHVSDPHVGKSPVEDPTGQYLPHFQKSLNQILPVLKPAFVIMTGDLTDASNGALPTVGQQQDEWDTYKSVYTAAGMKPDFYFDLPGNHDAYGESGSLSYFLKNSMQGQANGVPYVSWTVKIPDGEVLFFGLNSDGTGSTPMTNPPPEFTDDELDFVEKAMNAHSDAKLMIVGGHQVLEGSVNVTRLENAFKSVGGGYYLHGHRHEYSEYLGVGGTVVVNEIGGLGKMDDDNIGVVAVDHNGLVYRATAVEKPWPFVVITAPMSSTLRNGGNHPYAYQVCAARKNNPVRALVFADSAIAGAVAQIGSSPPSPMKPSAAASPLYEGEVDTTGLPAGPQTVTVTAKTASDQTSHSITVELVDGPCAALPVDPGSGGAGGSAGGGGSDAGGGVGGKSGSAGSGGKSDAGAVADASTDAVPDAATSDAAPTAADGGCSCGAVRTAAPYADWMLLIACFGFVMRRRVQAR
jgi:hypothetical protein